MDAVTLALIKSMAGKGGGSGGGGVLLVTLTYDSDSGFYVCDKTASEMWASAQNGTIVFKLIVGSSTHLYTLYSAVKGSEGYDFTMSTGESFDTDSDSGYPSGIIS